MIRKFVPEDREDYIRFSTEFYNSSAVDKPVPREHFEQGFDEMMRSDVYVQGYMLVCDGNNVGYCVTMKTYSVEAGGITIWIDELFVLEEYRSKVWAGSFLSISRKMATKSSAVSDLKSSLKTAEPYRFIRKWALSLRLTTECGKLFYSPFVNFP